MKRLLREPLLHFAVLGAALFVLDAALKSDGPTVREGEVVVSAGRIEAMAAIFTRTWQREPTAAELKGLIDEFVLEEILYREGIALGLDRDDTIIRRRMRQKMEFVVEDVVALVEPEEADLARWREENADRYRRSPRVTFIHVFLDVEERGDALESDAAALLSTLRSDPAAWDPNTMGDATLLPLANEDMGLDLVARGFGEAFAEGVAAAPVGEWSGPIGSAFGSHLVRVDARTESVLPPLDEIRPAVERDWRFARREEAAREYRDGLLERYDVTIEWPSEPDATSDETSGGGQ
ncbi:MAG: peptidylprolyl isomerase [Planctomycetota bacterium]